MSYATCIPTIVSLVLALTASRAQNTVPVAKKCHTGSISRNDAPRVFIYVIYNFYPYYCLFGFGSNAKTTFFFFYGSKMDPRLPFFFMALFWARSRVLDGINRGVAMCNANAVASGHKAIVLL